MIYTEYCCRLGNQLFQFAYACVVGRLAGVPIAAPPINGFPGTYGLTQEIPAETKRIPKSWINMNHEAIIQQAREGDVVIGGFPHVAEWYQPHQPWLKELMAPSDSDYHLCDKEDVVMHIRLGDVFKRSHCTRYQYPLDALKKVLEQISYRRCLIVTDEPNHEWLRSFIADYRCEIVAKDVLHDFRTLCQANRLIISPSTFGWWAVWLGKASEVYFPHELGFWKKEHHCRLGIRESRIRLFGANGLISETWKASDQPGAS